jgi:hypothetical protein
MRIFTSKAVLGTLLVVAVGGIAHAGDAADWNRFEIKGVTLGMHLKDLPAFKTCKYPPGYSRYARPYVRIMDKRCDQGNRCTVDNRESACGPFMNGSLASKGSATELEYMELIASTETDEPRVYRIWYYFQRQFLNEDSPLGKALIAKYGKYCSDGPDCYRPAVGADADTIGGGQMLFRSDHSDLHLTANCLPDSSVSHGATKDCYMLIEDLTILQQDREKQKEIDMRKAQQNQAEPPQL